MDKLLERCAKHRQATRGRKTKRTRSPRRNTSKLKQDTLATTPAPRTPTQITNQANKVAKIESSRHASTTKHAKDWQQAQTPLEPRKMKPDGTPKNPNDNPVTKHSTLTPDGVKIKLSPETAEMLEDIIDAENKHGTSAISIAQPDSQAPDTVDHIDTPKRTANTEPTPETQAPDIRGLQHPLTNKEREQSAQRTPSRTETSSAPGALTPTPSSDKDEGKKGDGGKGLTLTAALPLVKPHPKANKVGRKARSDILAMLAMNYTSRAIVVWLIQNHQVKVTRQAVDGYRNNKSRLRLTREILAKDIAKAVPLASKISRIAVRDEMVQELRRKPWIANQQTINRILDSIKAEMEPLEVNISVNLRAQTAQQYREVTDSGVIAEAMDKLKAAGMEVAQVVAPTEPSK